MSRIRLFSKRAACFALAVLLAACTAPTAAPTRTGVWPTPTPTYTPTARPPTDTPAPTVTATTMPTMTSTDQNVVTLPTELETLKIVYPVEKSLWIWEKGKSRPLTAIEEFTFVRMSDDGELVAYTKPGGLWLIKSDGSDEQLLVSDSDFAKMEPQDPGVYLANYDWVPGTHLLLFNTSLSSDWGPAWSNNDLYKVNADTHEMTIVAPPGKGGIFYASPDGEKVAASTITSIHLMDLDGNNWKAILTYPDVYTYSEFQFYPNLFWANNSQAIGVSIPPHDRYAETNPLSVIWYLPVNGKNPYQIMQITDDDLTRYNVHFSPDLKHVVYVMYGCQDANYLMELHIVDTNTGEDNTWGCIASFINWSPDSLHFLFRKDMVYLGDLNGSSIPLADVNGNTITWIDASNFFYVNDMLWIQPLGKSSIPIVELNDSSIYDFAK